MFTTLATVEVKGTADSEGKKKVLRSQEYQKVVFEGMDIVTDDGKEKIIGQDKPEELLAQAIQFFQDKVGKDGNGVIELLKNTTYAYDLTVRAGIRQNLLSALEGPEKAIEKGLKDMIAARAAVGKPITEEWKAKTLAMLRAASDE